MSAVPGGAPGIVSERRVALVTGAARGIGAASVAALVAQGYAVVAVDSCAGEGSTRPDAVSYPLATREQLEAVGAAGGGAVLTRVADVRDRAAMQDAARLAVAEHGRLDAVVAAAAVMAGGSPLWQTPDDELDALWQVDVRGVWTTAAVTVPLMLDGPAPGGCRFVALASAAGAHGLFRLAAYSAAKHAVVGPSSAASATSVPSGSDPAMTIHPPAP